MFGYNSFLKYIYNISCELWKVPAKSLKTLQVMR